MSKKLTHILMLVLLAVGVFGSTTPVFAHGEGNSSQVEGAISAVDSTAGTLTVTAKKSGAAFTFTVDATTLIKRNGKSALLADLKVGDKAEVKYDAATMLAKKVEAQFKLAELEGTVAAVDTTAGTLTVNPKKGGAPVTFTVDSTTYIKRSGKSATLADLQPGDKVEIKYDAATMLASRIQASFKLAELEGTVAAVDTTAGTVTITPNKGGADVTLSVDATTFIKRNGVAATLADIQVGDKVKAKYNAATMLASKLEVKFKYPELEGTVAAVDTTAGTITITPKKGGADVTLFVDATTFIKRNGAAATLADVLVGDKVEAKYNAATMLASKLEVKLNLSEVKGTVAAVDTVAGTITITPKYGGADVVLFVDASTFMKRNHAVATLADFVVGDKVEAKYNATTMLASKIESD